MWSKIETAEQSVYLQVEIEYMQERYCPNQLIIDTIIAENGYTNGCNTLAWVTIDKMVKQGQVTAYAAYLYGSETALPVGFPYHQLARCQQIDDAYYEIQNQLCDECEGQYPTPGEVWEKITELIKVGRFSAKDLYYYGVRANMRKHSTLADGDGDC